MALQTTTTKLSYRNAEQFVDDIKTSVTSLYMFMGRPQPWPLNGLGAEVVPSVEDHIAYEYNAWHDMTALKKVTGADVNLGFRRINWTTGTAYSEYTHDEDMTVLDFYVMTNELKVYKCISNNQGANSTEKPTHTVTAITKYSDGYKWKFMFQLSNSAYRKFAVGDYLPISSDSAVVANAAVGAVEHFKIVNAGEGYPISKTKLAGTEIPVFVKGDGESNNSASITLQAGDIIGGVLELNTFSVNADFVSRGSNYPYAPASNIPVMLRQVTATGAVETAFGLVATNSLGQVQTVQIVVGGSGYQTGTVEIVQSSAEGYAETNNAGEIINVEIENEREGSGFRKAEAVVVSTGTSAADIKPIISPFLGHGAAPGKELYARYALVNLRFAYDEGEGDFTIANDVRIFGLIKNPLQYQFDSSGDLTSTTELADRSTLDAKRRLTLGSVTNGPFGEDDVIYGTLSGAKALTIDTLGSDLRYIKDNTISNYIPFEVGENVTNGSAIAPVNAIKTSEVVPYSGDIMYINNRTAIDRNDAQIETITLVLEY